MKSPACRQGRPSGTRCLRKRGATFRAKRSRLRFICSGRSPGGIAHVTRSVISPRRMATSQLCRHQAFAYENAYGLLFYLELTPEMVASLMKTQCYRLLDNFFIQGP